MTTSWRAWRLKPRLKACHHKTHLRGLPSRGPCAVGARQVSPGGGSARRLAHVAEGALAALTVPAHGADELKPAQDDARAGSVIEMVGVRRTPPRHARASGSSLLRAERRGRLLHGEGVHHVHQLVAVYELQEIAVLCREVAGFLGVG